MHTATAEIVNRSLFLLCFYVHDTGETTFKQFAYLAFGCDEVSLEGGHVVLHFHEAARFLERIDGSGESGDRFGLRTALEEVVSDGRRGAVGHEGEVHIGVGRSLEDDSGVFGHVAFDGSEYDLSANNVQAESGDVSGHSVLKGTPEAGVATLANVHGQRGAYAFETNTGELRVIIAVCFCIVTIGIGSQVTAICLKGIFTIASRDGKSCSFTVFACQRGIILTISTLFPSHTTAGGDRHKRSLTLRVQLQAEKRIVALPCFSGEVTTQRAIWTPSIL